MKWSLMTAIFGVLVCGTGIGCWFRMHGGAWVLSKISTIACEKIRVAKGGRRAIALSKSDGIFEVDLRSKSWKSVPGTKNIERIGDICISSDGRVGACGYTSGEFELLWLDDMGQGVCQGKISSGVRKLFLEPKGRLVVLIGEDGIAHVIGNGELGEDFQLKTNGSAFFSCSSSVEGWFAFVNDGNASNIFDLTTRRLVKSFADDGRGIKDVYISPSLRKVFIAKIGGIIEVVDIDGESFIAVKCHNWDVWACDGVSGKNNLLSVSADETLKCWRMSDLGKISSISLSLSNVVNMSCSLDGERVLLNDGDGGIHVYYSDLSSEAFGTSGAYLYAEFGDMGYCIVALDREGNVSIWDRTRPEQWWGLAWLPEFWLTVVFGIALVWSLRRDWKTLRGKKAEDTAAEGSKP